MVGRMKKNQSERPQLLLTLRDAAHLLSVSETSVRRLIARGKLKPIRLWRHLRIPASQIDDIAKSSEKGGHHE
jgi:excisionase family DNA binding protein